MIYISFLNVISHYDNGEYFYLIINKFIYFPIPYKAGDEHYKHYVTCSN